MDRYHRQIIMPEVGAVGQDKLKAASVLVIGAGGLGCPALSYLTAAGIGTIGIVDGDCVDLSNLHRQVLYQTKDVGKPKSETAAKRLRALNPDVSFHAYPTCLDTDNALETIAPYDIVLDGTDNFPARYLINDACLLLDKVNVFASVFRFDGQLTVFNYKYDDGTYGPNYRDLYPAPPAADSVPSCAEGGVLGVLPGIMGALQAAEAIKILLGIGDPIVGRMMILDTLHGETRYMSFKKRPEHWNGNKQIIVEKLIDYDLFCSDYQNTSSQRNNTMIKEVNVSELKQMMDNNEDFQLIDVREPYEAEMAEMGGKLIPMGELLDRVDEISKDKKVVVHCRSGARSASVIQMLQDRFDYDNLYNLKGGILAWADQIDTSLEKY